MQIYLRERPLMMSDFREGGSKMTPKNRTLEGKNRMVGGVKNDQKKSDIIYGCSLTAFIKGCKWNIKQFITAYSRFHYIALFFREV